VNRYYGRFTLYGGTPVEHKIGVLVGEAAEAIEATIPIKSIRALVLIGGYGRGEGGVERVGNQEMPHNNLDFLLILKHGAASSLDRTKYSLSKRLQMIGQKHGVGMDLSVVTVSQLRQAPCLVLWHDMRFGHKTILGDADFVPSLTQFAPERIEASDIRNLLVNRGTLLLINQMLIEAGPLNEESARTIVGHGMKAIFGYGDALLFTKGAYHSSSTEKQSRMAAHPDIPSDFRALYDKAIEFRFQPDYGPYLKIDLAEWMRSLIAMLEPVHLACEASRLNRPGLTWAEYTDLTFQHSLSEGHFTLRNLARKAHRMSQSLPPLPNSNLLTRLGYRCGGWRGVLPAMFPVIAYGLALPNEQDRACKVLHADNTSQSDLRRAYLCNWSYHGDPNFYAAIQKFGLSLDRNRPADRNRPVEAVS